MGVVPAERETKQLLEAGGYTELEIVRSGVLADKRWPGRLCGAWRDEHANIRSLWARTLRDADTAPKYIYLRGAGRTGLPPYGVSDVLKLSSCERTELLLVEGLLDVHHLRAKGIANVAAIGSAQIRPEKLARLVKYGIETVTLALDNDQSGRDALARAIERTSRLDDAPALRVVDPTELGDAKDPDEYVRVHGVDRLRELVRDAQCGISWRTLDRMRQLEPTSPQRDRRAALEEVGKWLGELPPRLALEVEDAIRIASQRSGYDAVAVERLPREVLGRRARTARTRARTPADACARPLHRTVNDRELFNCALQAGEWFFDRRERLEKHEQELTALLWLSVSEIEAIIDGFDALEDVHGLVTRRSH